MPILPADFALPALPYLVGLLVAAGAVAASLYRRRPPVTERTVAALAPWMATGGVLYASYQAAVAPAAVAPLVSSPAVYVTVGVIAGTVWAAAADRPDEGWEPGSVAGVLGGTGVVALVVAVAWVVSSGGLDGAGAGVLSAIVVGSVVATAATWLALARVREVAATGAVGVLVVFGHALDGVSTAVGYGRLGFGEQTPLSRVVLEAGGALPGAGVLDGAWLFILVKLALAAVVVALFEGYVRDEPREGYLLLGLIVAVGLGPGAHNLVLFAVA